MKQSVALFIILTLSGSSLVFFSHLRIVSAVEEVHIRADGTFYPSTAPIVIDGNVYRLSADLQNAIIIEKDNIVLDGAGHTVLGVGEHKSIGIEITDRRNVTVRNVVLRGFYSGIRLSNSSGSRIHDSDLDRLIDGISIYPDCEDSVILGNNVTGNQYGISIGSAQVIVTENRIADQRFYGIILSGRACTISANEITNNSIAVFIDSGEDEVIVDNHIRNNQESGIGCGMGGINNTIINNTISENKVGIEFKITSTTYLGNSVIENRIFKNKQEGISARFLSNSTIRGNSITQNSGSGIWLWNSEFNTIAANEIEGNSVGINLDQSHDNKIYHNNFRNNTEHVLTSDAFDAWDNGYPSGGNYWSTYNGTDRNGDGIGDTPHSITGLNIDHYPLVQPYIIPEFSPLSITLLCTVATVLAIIFHKRRNCRRRH